MTDLPTWDALIDEVAVAISGAPFPSDRTKAKAAAVVATLSQHIPVREILERKLVVMPWPGTQGVESITVAVKTARPR